MMKRIPRFSMLGKNLQTIIDVWQGHGIGIGMMYLSVRDAIGEQS